MRRLGGNGRSAGRERLAPLCGALCLIVLGLSLSCGVALAAGPRSATFKATIEGTQTSSATLAAEQCDPGASSETINFASAPFKIKVTQYNRTLTITGAEEDGRARFSVSGSVTRSNSGEVSCHDDPERPRDCGTKSFPKILMAAQEFSLAGRWQGFNFIDWDESAEDVFDNCSNVAAQAFPSISGGRGTDVVVARSALLNRHRRTIVASGTSTVTGEGGYDSKSTGTVTIKLMLKRV